MASSSTRVFGNYCRTLMAAAKTSTATAPPNPTTTATSTTGKGRYKGILKPVPISPTSTFYFFKGDDGKCFPRKYFLFVDYIKTNNLQNPANKKEINCDDKLKTIFAGKDKVGFLEIAKLLSSHFQKAS
ncbi:uncharacterized protein LOC132042541 [Lycium ferocissimum]|uniref:uncharacterized protein LOC132042541 n=1 Tax=Lycium ferocissimum TaxID=112874 RepID=UPI002815D7D6|nr:uncharacterized protein LOC132042541 [Lycium ferocissimum]